MGHVQSSENELGSKKRNCKIYVPVFTGDRRSFTILGLIKVCNTKKKNELDCQKKRRVSNTIGKTYDQIWSWFHHFGRIKHHQNVNGFGIYPLISDLQRMASFGNMFYHAGNEVFFGHYLIYGSQNHPFRFRGPLR